GDRRFRYRANVSCAQISLLWKPKRQNHDSTILYIGSVYMASWLLKAIVQRGIGALPNPHYWNGLLQDRLTHSTELTDERFAGNLRNCENHLAHLCRYGSAASCSFSAFEIGTGWWPVVPIGLFLGGAREVWIWDIAPRLNLDSLKATIRRFL